MKVHIETIDVLCNLYSRCRQVLDEEYDPDKQSEDALEIAAMDYMTCPERDQFFSVVNDLDDEIRRELIALVGIGKTNETDHAAAAFETLKKESVAGPDTANDLFGEQRLIEYWNTALKTLGVK